MGSEKQPSNRNLCVSLLIKVLVQLRALQEDEASNWDMLVFTGKLRVFVARPKKSVDYSLLLFLKRSVLVCFCTNWFSAHGADPAFLL